MADGEDIQALVCDNGTGMVKVRNCIHLPGLHHSSPHATIPI